MKHIARRDFLRGASTLVLTSAFPRISVGQSFVHPDDYALPGDNATSRINRMLELAPLGSRCYIPGKYLGQPLIQTVDPVLGPQPYYLRCRRNVSIVSDSNHRNPIIYDDSGGQADVLLIEPEAPDYTILQTEISGLKFNPRWGGINYELMAYDPADPRCNYARDIVRINGRAGFGIAKMWMHDCWLPYGTGWGLNIIGLDGQASIYNSTFERIWTYGGLRIDRAGDANRFLSCALGGKTGLDYHIQDGAGEYLFENISIVPRYGQAIVGRGGNKITMRQVYIEQQALPTGLPKIVMDLRHGELTGQEQMNALTLDGITVANQSGQSLDQLIRIGRAFSPILRRINFYATQPVVNALKIDSDCTYPQLQGPFTYNGTYTGPRIDCPKETKPYGVSVGPAWWNTQFQNSFNQTGNHVNITKDPSTGVVTFAGEFQSITTGLPAIETVCGVPEGFGAKEEVAFPISQGFGLPSVMLIVAPANAAGPGVVSMEGIHPSASRFRASVSWHNKDHIDGIGTNN